MKTITLGTLLLFSSLSFAAAETNQTLMPAGSQSELTTGLSFAGSAIKATAGTTSYDVKGSGFAVPLRYYYGLSEGNAIGAEFSFGAAQNDTDISVPAGTTKTTNKITGLGDMLVNYKGRLDLGSPSLYYSAGYRFGLEKTKSEDKSATETESTRATSHPSILLQVGVVQPISTFKIGGLFQYDIAQKGEKESKSTVSTKNYSETGGGGTSLHLFAEMENDFHPNLSLDYDRTYTIEGTASNGTSTTQGNELIGWTLSGRMAFASNFEFLPSLSYQTIKDKDAGIFKFDKYEVYTANILGRFLF